MKELKQKLYTHCQNWIEERIRLAKGIIDNAQSASNLETKSSAGDKYETGRAMAQLEIEKGSIQLAEAAKLQRLMNEFSPNTASNHIKLGSLVLTNRDWYYLSLSAGKVTLDNHTIICLSPVSPLGSLMMGLKAGESYQFKNHTNHINEVY